MNMKNKAFTLAEGLMVLSIVSVLAAVSVTAVSNAKPDESIIMFRRGYKMMSTIINDMLNDRELYPYALERYTGVAIPTDSLLGSTNAIKGFGDNSITETMKANNPYLNCAVNSCDADFKFADIFIHKANPVSFNDVLPLQPNKTKKEMVTPDGMYWYIYSDSSMAIAGALGPMTITLYTNGKGKGCTYHATNCKYPTNFIFNIQSDGKIETTDPMACSYLRYTKVTKASKIPTNSTINSCFQ